MLKKKSPIFTNIFWLFLDKGYGAVLTLYIYSKIATYFGADLFGVWNYIISFGAFIPAVASLGLNYIIVKKIKQHPMLQSNIITVSFYLRLLFGMLFSLAVLGIYALVGFNFEADLKVIVVLIFISQIVLNTNIYIQKNEANLENRKTVIARNISLTLFFILRLLAIDYGLGILYFALFMLLENLMFLLLNKLFDQSKVIMPRVKRERRIAFSLVKEGLPLMLAAITTTLYLKIDQIFIAFYYNNSQVGIYAASTRISEFLYAIPVIISAVYFPKLMESNKEKTDTLMNEMFTGVAVLAIICVGGVTIFSENIINLLYDFEYIEAAKILKIHVWTLLLMGFLVSSSKFLLKTNRQDIIFKRELLGLTANILLNILFIPKYGIYGAAWATLISYSISSLFANLLFKHTRFLFKQQLLSVFYYLKKM